MRNGEQDWIERLSTFISKAKVESCSEGKMKKCAVGE